MAFSDGNTKGEAGQIIRREREARGMSQRELAALVGSIDAAGVSKIETGATKLGRVRARRFARALQLDVSRLLPPASPQPSPRELLDHLESLEARLDDLAYRVADNQGLVATALERITALLLRRDERELSIPDPLPPTRGRPGQANR